MNLTEPNSTKNIQFTELRLDRTQPCSLYQVCQIYAEFPSGIGEMCPTFHNCVINNRLWRRGDKVDTADVRCKQINKTTEQNNECCFTPLIYYPTELFFAQHNPSETPSFRFNVTDELRSSHLKFFSVCKGITHKGDVGKLYGKRIVLTNPPPIRQYNVSESLLNIGLVTVPLGRWAELQLPCGPGK